MKNVLLIDSGSGGLNVLLECVKVAPLCNYLFFCDNKNLPYGNKTKDELVVLTLENLRQIKKFFDFEIVVFACNTLTATAIKTCRELNKEIEFVGTEPAIKPALEEFNPKDIIVLATETTIKHNQKLKRSGAKLVGLKNLAADIDKNLDELHKVDISFLNTLKAKAVVLGCTHYKAIEKEISAALGGAKVFSSENGVARRLKSILNGEATNCQVQIVTSKNDGFLVKLLDYYNKKSR